MRNEIVEFFKKLSERHWIENDLSDMMWSLLKVSEDFRKIFFDLLRSKGNPKDLSYLTSENYLDVEREFNAKEISGRPDLRFEFLNDHVFILEVKVGDKNYHSNYSDLGNADIGLLTISNVKDLLDPGWVNFTWKELHDHIIKSDNDLIVGFAEFLKGVFYMEDIQKIEKFEIKYLIYLNRMIKAALLEIGNEGTFKVKLTSGVRTFFVDGSGYYFTYSLDDKYFQPWIGINYNVETESGNPFGLMLWLNGHHSMHLKAARSLSADSILKNKLFPESEFHCKADKNELVIMPKNWQESFLCLGGKDQQLKFIKDFILQCLHNLEYLYDATKIIY
ncbi:MAG: hypothetical protein HF312_17475 [Ignavibacteria bacterium]|jgi:hypothetical protein|nr:hypothetical protein [Ignavibacteria bacterium]MCU7522009.1 hypothetical protein [Ignavibacteria bacterium]